MRYERKRNPVAILSALIVLGLALLALNLYGLAGAGVFGDITKRDKDEAAEMTYVTPADVYVPVDVDCGEQILFIGRHMRLSDIISNTDEAALESAEITGAQPGVVEISGTDISALAVGDARIEAVFENGDKYSVTIESRKVAYLTFDDFPNEFTPVILDTLAEKKAVASFFLCHQGNEKYHYLYTRIKEEGHCFGNHTGSHKQDYLFEGGTTLIDGFMRMEPFYDTFGIRTKLVRMPNGTADPKFKEMRTHCVRYMKNMGYTWVDWTASTEDSYNRKYETLMKNLKESCDDYREIILMHNLEATSKYCGDMIDWLREQGYEFERLDDAPQVYCFLYGWYDNINKRGAGLYDPQMLSGLEFSC